MRAALHLVASPSTQAARIHALGSDRALLHSAMNLLRPDVRTKNQCPAKNVQ
jgi:hypothetical protein